MIEYNDVIIADLNNTNSVKTNNVTVATTGGGMVLLLNYLIQHSALYTQSQALGLSVQKLHGSRTLTQVKIGAQIHVTFVYYCISSRVFHDVRCHFSVPGGLH